jgi:hypothetical protein
MHHRCVSIAFGMVVKIPALHERAAANIPKAENVYYTQTTINVRCLLPLDSMSAYLQQT